MKIKKRSAEKQCKIHWSWHLEMNCLEWTFDNAKKRETVESFGWTRSASRLHSEDVYDSEWINPSNHPHHVNNIYKSDTRASMNTLRRNDTQLFGKNHSKLQKHYFGINQFLKQIQNSNLRVKEKWSKIRNSKKKCQATQTRRKKKSYKEYKYISKF